MVHYDRRILNKLLDSYEDSLLFIGGNKRSIHISFPFSRKSMPEYFDESSIAYDEIHASMNELERKGLVEIVWKGGRSNHIIEKVLLNYESISMVYLYLNREPKEMQIQKNIDLLEQIRETYKGKICNQFAGYLLQRLKEGKTVKEFIDISDSDKTKRLIRAVSAVENNEKTCYIREFSIEHFGDSKVFEEMEGLVVKVIKRFDKSFEDMDTRAVLAEYLIYQTPNYIYIKGVGSLRFREQSINLSLFQQGLGIAGEDLLGMKLYETEKINKVITIENLTTFFRWREENSIIIYLGGYHNSVRRALLNIIYRQIPQAEYLHFGDIDVGGYEIYEDLCRKTGIPFQLYYMNVETLEKYKKYTRELTANDRQRIKKILNSDTGILYTDVLEYMLRWNVKLEQECVLARME